MAAVTLSNLYSESEQVPDLEFPSLHERLTTLEHWRIQLDIANARAEEQRKHLDQRFDQLDGKVTKISESLSWIVRIVLGAVVLAAVTFAMKGGFNI